MILNQEAIILSEEKVNKIFKITTIDPESSVTGKFNDQGTRTYPA